MTTDPQGVEAPKFIVSPSQVLAVVKTIASLLTFGIFFGTTMVGFARDLDLQGALIFLQRDDVVAWISALATALWLIWRSRAAWHAKLRDILLVKAAPNTLAVFTTELVPAPAPLAPAADRASLRPAPRLVPLHRGAVADFQPTSIAPLVTGVQPPADMLDLRSHPAGDHVLRAGGDQ